MAKDKMTNLFIYDGNPFTKAIKQLIAAGDEQVLLLERGTGRHDSSGYEIKEGHYILANIIANGVRIYGRVKYDKKLTGFVNVYQGGKILLHKLDNILILQGEEADRVKKLLKEN